MLDLGVETLDPIGLLAAAFHFIIRVQPERHANPRRDFNFNSRN
jgi:hypothetical protein